MQKLFVSYAREDRRRVEPLVDLLRAAGFEVFWDQSLHAGVEWAEFLDDQLDTADCLLVLWTPSSVASRWVRTEAHEALQQDKLLPVLLDDVRQPLPFRQIQCFDLIGWQGDTTDPRLARLAGELRTGFGASRSPPAAASAAASAAAAPAPVRAPAPAPAPTPVQPPTTRTDPSPPPPPPERAWLGAGVIATVLAIGIGLAWVAWRPKAAVAIAPGADVSGPPASAVPASAVAPDPATAPPPAVAVTPPPAITDSQRCAAINEQVSLNLPVSSADRAFLKRGCKS